MRCGRGRTSSVVLAAAFIWRERRAAYPLLDLRCLRVPQFTTPNVVAFCAYFSTFAIFFFAALYLVEVVGASGFRLALVFLPMTVLMIASSLLAGRWMVRAGPRWSITAGCLLFAAGLFAAAYTAFHDGLHAALYLSAGLVLAAGMLAFITLRPRPAAAGMLTIPPGPGDREDGQP